MNLWRGLGECIFRGGFTVAWIEGVNDIAGKESGMELPLFVKTPGRRAWSSLSPLYCILLSTTSRTVPLDGYGCASVQVVKYFAPVPYLIRILKYNCTVLCCALFLGLSAFRVFALSCTALIDMPDILVPIVSI
jgi:hypothetical protein